MPSWPTLLEHLTNLADDQQRADWLVKTLEAALRAISAKRNNRNVVFYCSGFLQKPQVPGYFTQITHEDINGFMACLHGMDYSKGLSLMLHTPGGAIQATETVVDYLRSKFTDIEAIVPVYAMSAGTMMSLSANRIIMGRQSQLGPIDPQLQIGGKTVSARAIVEQFEKASNDIKADRNAAHAWAPILQSLGPALLVEAQNALDYGERMVAGWLEEEMFNGRKDAKKQAKATASHFNDASTHKSHGRRINRDEARSVQLLVEDLEADQDLQDAVLTAYHLTSIMLERSPTAKALWTSHGQTWLRNYSAKP